MDYLNECEHVTDCAAYQCPIPGSNVCYHITSVERVGEGTQKVSRSSTADVQMVDWNFGFNSVLPVKVRQVGKTAQRIMPAIVKTVRCGSLGLLRHRLPFHE